MRRGTVRQVQLLREFPASSRREAAEVLGRLNRKLSALDKSLASGAQSAATPSVTLSAATLTAAISEAQDLARQVAKLYNGVCVVCPDQIRASKQDEGFDNPNLRKLKDFEPRLLRRPDERDESYARKLGFREGELIGGY